MTLWGRDSYHNNLPPDSKSMGGKSFWILKATQGTSFQDPTFHDRLRVIKAGGMIPGAYHFGDGASSGAQQADYFLDFVGDTKGLMLYLDFEHNPLGSSMNVNQASDFLMEVYSRVKRKAGLYSYVSGYPNIGQSSRWVAHPGPPPSIPWDIWQYGADGYGDLNRTDHDIAWLQAQAGGEEMPQFPDDLATLLENFAVGLQKADKKQALDSGDGPVRHAGWWSYENRDKPAGGPGDLTHTHPGGETGPPS